VAKRKQSSARRDIPKARVVPRLTRIDVTRAEYNRIIDVLNERNIILNGLREGLERVEHAIAVQFTRIAQLQADVDELKNSRKGAA
jgi:hypothetical protein